MGIRNAIRSWDDYKNDYDVGFIISHAEDIEEVGWRGIVKRIREVVGDNPVYSMWGQSVVTILTQSHCSVSLDIDVLDPAQAPATGT